MGANAELLRLMGPELELLLPALDEKARRLALGAVARAAGDGGVTAVARMTGAAWQTVADGAAELASGQCAPEGRVRRPGGGRSADCGGPGSGARAAGAGGRQHAGGSGVAAGVDGEVAEEPV